MVCWSAKRQLDLDIQCALLFLLILVILNSYQKAWKLMSLYLLDSPICGAMVQVVHPYRYHLIYCYPLPWMQASTTWWYVVIHGSLILTLSKSLRFEPSMYLLCPMTGRFSRHIFHPSPPFRGIMDVACIFVPDPPFRAQP